MIYSIEPIIAQLGVGQFNQVLCGTGNKLLVTIVYQLKLLRY